MAFTSTPSLASTTFVQIYPQPSNVKDWREQLTKATGLDHDRLRQILTYATRNIWKERCRLVFDNKALPADQLAQLIMQDVAAYRQAHANPMA